MFGEVKTKDSTQPTKSNGDDKQPLDAKKGNPQFAKGEGDATKKETPKTNVPKSDIKNKEEKTQDGKESEDDEKDEKSEPKSDSKPEVKKIDLKTKKS
jgi:hypothetical protein